MDQGFILQFCSAKNEALPLRGHFNSIGVLQLLLDCGNTRVRLDTPATERQFISRGWASALEAYWL